MCLFRSARVDRGATSGVGSDELGPCGQVVVSIPCKNLSTTGSTTPWHSSGKKNWGPTWLEDRGDRTTDMNGGSTASYLARTPRVPFCYAYFHRSGSKGLLDFQGRRGIASIQVRWNIRPVSPEISGHFPWRLPPAVSGENFIAALLQASQTTFASAIIP